MTKKQYFRQLLNDLHKRNYISIEQCSMEDKKEILNAFLDMLGRERSHEIFVDADREGRLLELFQSWLAGKISAHEVCNYILISALLFYADDMDDELENIRAEFLMDRKYGT